MDKNIQTWGIFQSTTLFVTFFGDYVLELPRFFAAYSGAAVFQFCLFVVIIGIPLMYVQITIGAVTRSGIVGALDKFCPVLKGVGIALMLRLVLVSISGHVLVAYCIYYMFLSLYKPFVWGHDDGDCDDEGAEGTPVVLLDNVTLVTPTLPYTTEGLPPLVLPPAKYFTDSVLKVSGDIMEDGIIPWYLGISLVAAWFLTLIIVMGGKKWLGWMLALLVCVSLVLTMALIAYGREELTYDRPHIIYYSPNWTYLRHWQNWFLGCAIVLRFFVIWYGILPMTGKCASKRQKNVYIASILGIVLVILTSQLISNTWITYLGAYAKKTGKDLRTLATQDTLTTVFGVMPHVFQTLDLGRGIAFVYYFTIGLFLLQHQGLIVAVVLDSIFESLRPIVKPRLKSKLRFSICCSAIYCTVGLLLGLPQITQGGLYVYLMTQHWIDRLLFVLVILSSAGLVATFAKQKLHVLHKAVILSWFSISSLFSAASLIFMASLHLEPMKFVVRPFWVVYEYPYWAKILGWLIAAAPLAVGLPAGLIHAVISDQPLLMWNDPSPEEKLTREQQEVNTQIANGTPPSSDSCRL